MSTATLITPQTIREEDGAEFALSLFAEQVIAGEEAIRRIIASAEPGTVWDFNDLRDKAAEGRRPTAMGVALMSLDSAGILRVDYARSTVEALA